MEEIEYHVEEMIKTTKETHQSGRDMINLIYELESSHQGYLDMIEGIVYPLEERLQEMQSFLRKNPPPSPSHYWHEGRWIEEGEFYHMIDKGDIPPFPWMERAVKARLEREESKNGN